MQNPSTTDTRGCFAVNGGRARTCTLASPVSYNLKTSFLLKFLKIIYFALQKNSCVKTKKTDHPCANFSTSLSNFSMHSFNFKNYNSWKICRWGWRTMGERMRNFPEMPHKFPSPQECLIKETFTLGCCACRTFITCL